jgi:hypothetical protein
LSALHLHYCSCPAELLPIASSPHLHINARCKKRAARNLQPVHPSTTSTWMPRRSETLGELFLANIYHAAISCCSSRFSLQKSPPPPPPPCSRFKDSLTINRIKEYESHTLLVRFRALSCCTFCPHGPCRALRRRCRCRRCAPRVQPLLAVQGSGPSVRTQYSYMLALTALVMAATLAALLLQSTSPLLPILQDMDMCPPPPLHNRRPHFTRCRPGQSTPAPISTCTLAADGSHGPSSRPTSRALPALSLQSKRESSCPVAAACRRALTPPPCPVAAACRRALTQPSAALMRRVLSSWHLSLKPPPPSPEYFTNLAWTCLQSAWSVLRRPRHSSATACGAPFSFLKTPFLSSKPLFFPQNPFSFLKTPFLSSKPRVTHLPQHRKQCRFARCLLRSLPPLITLQNCNIYSGTMEAMGVGAFLPLDSSPSYLNSSV